MDEKCLPCISEYLNAQKSHEALGPDKGTTVAPVYEKMVSEAITLAPSWQQTMVGAQLMMACVTIPVCLRHIGVQDPNPAQRLLSNGLTLPG